MEAIEIRDREGTELWLIAGLGLARLAPASAVDLSPAVAWVLAGVEEVPWLPPAGVLADLGHLLTRRSAVLVPSVAPEGARRLRTALRLYEDAWIGRLTSDRRADTLGDALAALKPELRPRAVAVTVASVLERIGFDGGATINVGAARRILRRGPAELVADVHRSLQSAGAHLTHLALGYEALARAARRAPRLLDDPDLFAVEHLAVLETAAQRVAVAQVMEAAADLGRAMPRNLKPRRREGASVHSELEAESAYPAGGFAAISNSGSLENLVTSEVVYMEDASDGFPIDLFDVRYAEGELLYYTRDEAIHRRPRREVIVALDPSLSSLRFKDPTLRWQRIVLLLAVVVCWVRRLFEWLTEEDLKVRVVFLSDERAMSPLAPECGLCQILLKEWVDRGVVEVREASLDEISASATLACRRAYVHVVLLGPEAQAVRLRRACPAAAHTSADVLAVAPEWMPWVDLMVETMAATL